MIINESEVQKWHFFKKLNIQTLVGFIEEIIQHQARKYLLF